MTKKGMFIIIFIDYILSYLLLIFIVVDFIFGSEYEFIFTVHKLCVRVSLDR